MSINKANIWSSFINSTLSIVIVVGACVFACSNAYIMIFDCAKEIVILKKEIKERDVIIEEKATKRYMDAMNMATDFKMQINENEKRVNELEKQLEFLKGQHIQLLK